MAIVVVGINHRSVSLDVLERVNVARSQLPKALATVAATDPVHETVVLSTCNRVEVYATVHRFHAAVQAVRHSLSDIGGVPQEDVATGLYTYYDRSAVRHLFGVAAGIDSMVVGEPEILGQVREAYRIADEEGTVGRILGPLFRQALRVGKRARSETDISRHVVSLPQAAARTATTALGRPPREAVVLGAGRMGELAARSLTGAGAERVVICNRSEDRAVVLADRLGLDHRPYEELADALRSADVLVAATSSSEAVVHEEHVTGREDDLVIVDLGVPRDVAPGVRGIEGVRVWDLEDLRGIVEEGERQRRAELPKVEALMDESVDTFCAWERTLALGPAITALTERSEEIRAEEIDAVVRRSGLSEAQREMLDVLTRRIARKLLHAPVSRVKDLVGGPDGQVYLEAFQELFDLDVREP